MKDIIRRQHGRHWWGRQAWLPWTPFADTAKDYRQRAAAAGPLTPAHGRQAALLTLTAGLVGATTVFSLALPRLSLFVEIIGGLLVSVVVLICTDRISDVPVALRELRVTIEEGAERSSFASQLHLLRLGLLDLLLRVQTRRAEARRADALLEETPNADPSRIADTHSNLGRDLGIHVHGRQDGDDGKPDPGHESGRSGRLGTRLWTPTRFRGRVPQWGNYQPRSVRLQASPPAPALASSGTSGHRTDTAPSPSPRFLPTAGGGVDQRPRSRFARGGESVPVPVTPPPLSPPSRPARGALPVSPSSAPLPVPAPHPTPGDGGTEQ